MAPTEIGPAELESRLAGLHEESFGWALSCEHHRRLRVQRAGAERLGREAAREDVSSSVASVSHRLRG